MGVVLSTLVACRYNSKSKLFEFDGFNQYLGVVTREEITEATRVELRELATLLG